MYALRLLFHRIDPHTSRPSEGLDRERLTVPVESLHPGVGRDDLRAAMAWEPRWSDVVATTEPPSVEELRLIREELDPAGVYTR